MKPLLPHTEAMTPKTPTRCRVELVKLANMDKGQFCMHYAEALYARFKGLTQKAKNRIIVGMQRIPMTPEMAYLEFLHEGRKRLPAEMVKDHIEQARKLRDA